MMQQVARTVRAMRLATWIAVVFAATQAIDGTSALAQVRDSTPPVRVLGIYDAKTGDPLAGVQVRDGFSGDYTVSSITGTVALTFLTFRGQAAVIELRKLGYEPKRLYLTRDDPAPLTELMEPVPTLAPVVTTEKYRVDRDAGLWENFEARCAVKHVTCVRDSALTARPLLNTADFLLRAPGITIGSCARSPGSATGMRSAQCGRVAMRSLISADPYCEPTFFVDGYEWNVKGGAPIDLVPGQPPVAPFKPTNIKGIEVYLPEQSRPMRYQGNPNCGAVVIWTK